MMNTGDISDQWAGLAALTAGLLGACVSTLDLLPFRSESGP
jgi:hypothetical protein